MSAHAAGSGLPGVCVANTDYVAQYGANGLPGAGPLSPAPPEDWEGGADGCAPVLLLHANRLSAMASARSRESAVFENLDPYISGTGYDVTDFSTGLLLSSQYEGRQVAMPFLHSTQVIYYNKTIRSTSAEYWSSRACHHTMVMGSVTS